MTILRRLTPIGRHSADFNWGYGGSGPAELALALCLDAVDNYMRDGAPNPDRVYEYLKWDVVSRLPRGPFVLPVSQVVGRLAAYTREIMEELR